MYPGSIIGSEERPKTFRESVVRFTKTLTKCQEAFMKRMRHMFCIIIPDQKRFWWCKLGQDSENRPCDSKVRVGYLSIANYRYISKLTTPGFKIRKKRFFLNWFCFHWSLLSVTCQIIVICSKLSGKREKEAVIQNKKSERKISERNEKENCNFLL